jgi:NAD(P)-dependent dehydrogenase (short-subunit alcohol dehydrogenase family)
MSEDKAIAVTGGSRGIGSAIVRNLASRGLKVACLSRKGEGVEDAELTPEMQANIRAYRCDVTDSASIAEALRAVVGEHGGLRGVVSNAGIHLDGPSESFAVADFERVLSTNATATFAVAQQAYPYLQENNGALLVTVGSFYDNAGVPRNAAYAASKAAVGAIARCLAVEWARAGIRVLNVAPGFIATDLNRHYLAEEKFKRYLQQRIPARRAGEPEEVGRLVGALFAEDISFLTGETIYIDGAQGIAR